MATNFRFLKFRFFRRNSETTRDGHVVPGKENVGNFLFSRVAPFVMTSDDPESRNCFRFVLLLLLLRVRSTQKVRDRFSSFFSLQLVGLPALMIAAELGCYPQTRCRRNEFCHFRTFAVRSGRCFVMLSFHSFDLLYSTGLVAWRKVMAAPTAGFMTHITCRLTAKNRDRLRNPTLGNRVWATFTLP